MPARILILDAVATNRIVLKVKMLSAQFTVDACATTAEALRAIGRNKPDLILLSPTSDGPDPHAFCKALRRSPTTAPCAIIALGVSDTAMARFAAIDAGADDVMARPVNDALLLARIRSLLRARSAGQELALRETTSRALGFEDLRSRFATPPKVALVTANPAMFQSASDQLARDLGHHVQVIGVSAALGTALPEQAPDLLIIDATTVPDNEKALFGLVSDLRSRADTRLAKQLILTPPAEPEVTALFLDLGADDAVPFDVSAPEISLRAQALIQHKQQHDQLRATVRDGLHAAITDPLTGLYNRRYLGPHLKQMHEQAASSGRGFAVMMLDIDHFKTINDTHGHQAGDQVLIQLSDRLRENLRAIDMVARIGGEEFLVAMPRTSVRQARLAADRLRRTVNNAPFDIGRNTQPIKVTISVGVAVSDQSGCTDLPVDALCACADRALYVAKSAGRNQISMAQSAA